ncbi:MAG TPA: hypothetical protein VHC47_09445 [Mucilaginibacter sp.]|nr:hypothetical protein [Mucilaginibacter sp.]
MKPFIPTSVYGFFNYVLALTMMSSPWLFGFQDAHGAALFLPLYLGWLQLLMAIFSNHQWGIIKVFPVPMHCFIDVVFGFFLLISPFLYGYYIHVFWPQLLMGIVWFSLGMFTQHSPVTDEPHHVFKDGLLNDTADVDEAMTH